MCWPCLKDPIGTLSCESLHYVHVKASQHPLHVNYKFLPVLVLSLCSIEVMPDAIFAGTQWRSCHVGLYTKCMAGNHTMMTC